MKFDQDKFKQQTLPKREDEEVVEFLLRYLEAHREFSEVILHDLNKYPQGTMLDYRRERKSRLEGFTLALAAIKGIEQWRR